jgi:cytochrome c553
MIAPMRCAVLLGALAFASPGAARAAAPPDTLAQRLAPCTACHDDTGRRGPDAYYPRIAGKPAGYLFNQLQNFRDGRRFYALMTYLVEHLPDAYLREIAEHFSRLQPPFPAPQPATARHDVLARGRTLTESGDVNAQIPACAECHGKTLTGVVPAIPSIVGLPRDYLIAQLMAWRSGTRRSHEPDCMALIAKRLSNEDITSVAAWLASQPVLGRAAVPATPPSLPIDCGGVPGGPGSASR